MIAEDIKVEWDEGGCYLHVDGETWRVADPEQLYDRVKAAILPWLMERDEAFREFKAQANEYVVAIREDGSYRMEPDEDAYDPTDPKHPRYHSTHADIWDAREGK